MKTIVTKEYGKIYVPYKHFVRKISSQVEDYFKGGIDVKPGDIVVDVGANIGLFSLEVSRRTNGACNIYSIEPVYDNFVFLRKNIDYLNESNGLDAYKANAINIGLSNTNGRMTFYHSSLCPAVSSYSLESLEDFKKMMLVFENEVFSNTEKASNYNAELPLLIRILPRFIKRVVLRSLINRMTNVVPVICEVMTFEKFIKDNKINHIDLLKIDVEGAELDIIEGITNDNWAIIDKVIIEVHDINGRFKIIEDKLNEQGFDCFVSQEGQFRDIGASIYNLHAIKKISL